MKNIMTNFFWSIFWATLLVTCILGGGWMLSLVLPIAPWVGSVLLSASGLAGACYIHYRG